MSAHFSSRFALVASFAFLALTGCTADDAQVGAVPQTATTGSSGSGGQSQGQGGKSASGGAVSSGGASQGGNVAQGGAEQVGGSAPQGGAEQAGGSQPQGGAEQAGGSQPQGGAEQAGGANGGCSTDADCKDPIFNTCVAGKCVEVGPMPGCGSDADCAAGQVCEAGKCVNGGAGGSGGATAACSSDGECGCGCFCVNAECKCTGAIPPTCSTDADCGPPCAGFVCVAGACQQGGQGGSGGASGCTTSDQASQACQNNVPGKPIGYQCTGDGPPGCDFLGEIAVYCCAADTKACQVSSDCGADEFCDFPSAGACLVFDVPGTCAKRPADCGVGCSQFGVCGCDGQQYCNECEANKAGVDVTGPGPCGGPSSCSTDADCAAGEVCISGLCTTPNVGCGSDADCAAGEACVNNVCVGGPGCVSDADCAAGQACVGGVCTGAASCQVSSDCAADEFCDFASDGECVLFDALGTCAKRPVDCGIGCTQDGYCGCDGKVYCSECEAHKAGTDVAAVGGCGGAQPPCQSDADCAAGQVCKAGFCAAP